MRVLLALAGIVVLTACAESEPVRPAHPQRRASSVDPAASALAAMQASEERHAAERQASSDASGALVAEMLQKDEAKKLAAKETEKAARRKVCDDSRERRVNRAKEMIIARMDAETRLLLAAKAIRASCKLSERATGAVNVQRSGSGYRVSPELVDDVKCGPLPKGITKPDAWVLLTRDREGITKPTGPILDADDASPEDGQCAPFDHEAGLDFGAATFENPMAITWTPPVTHPTE